MGRRPKVVNKEVAPEEPADEQSAIGSKKDSKASDGKGAVGAAPTKRKYIRRIQRPKKLPEEKRTPKVRKTRSTKRIFFELKGASNFPESCKLYSTLSPSTEANLASGFFLGNNIELQRRVENESFVYVPTELLISCSDSVANLLFVGFREGDAPLNIFDRKGGPSLLAIYSHDLKLLELITFDQGIVLSIRIISSDKGAYMCYLLFQNGQLGYFVYSYSPTRPVVNTRPAAALNLSEEYGYKANPRVSDFCIIESEVPVIKFFVQGDTLVYTDGFVVTVITAGKKTRSKHLKVLLVDLVLFEGDDLLQIIMLDRGGRHLRCNLDFSDMKTMFTFAGFFQLLSCNNGHSIYTTDGCTTRLLASSFKTFPKPDRLSVRDYLGYANGTIEIYRPQKKSVSKSLFKIVNAKEGLIFCVTEAEMNVFKSNKHYIVHTRGYYSYVLLCSAFGFIMKLWIC